MTKTPYKYFKHRSPIEVLQNHLNYYRTIGDARAIEEFELSIELLMASGIK